MSVASETLEGFQRVAQEFNSLRAGTGTPLSTLTLQEIATPSTPGPGMLKVYAKADNLLYSKDEAGVERQITAATLASNGIRSVDTFAGANDAAKWTAAAAFVQAEDTAGRYMPWIQIPDRDFDTGASSFAGFNGMKVVGPGVPIGPNNIQIDEQLINGKWSTQCGSGASSLFNFTAETYGVKVVGLVFHGSSTSQIFRSTVNVYAAQFDNLFFYGCKHAFGSTAEKFLMTQVIFSGHWGFSGCVDTLGHLGGSDNSLWMGAAFANIDLAANGAGKPLWHFNGMSKCDVGKMYVTNRNDWVGVRVSGNQSHDIAFFGGEYEGVSAASPSAYPVFDVQGGSVTMYSPKCGQVASGGANANGVFHQSGGQLTIYSPAYRRGTATAVAFPFVYQTAGTCKIFAPAVLTTGEQMRVRTSDGAVLTLAAHSNDFVTAEIEAYQFSMVGTMSVKVGTSKIVMEGSYVVESVRAYANTAPTGASAIVDINRNGTTIYTTQGNRPTIGAGANSALGGAAANGAFVSGDILSVDVDQIGSTVAGADLTVTIRMRRVG